MIDPLLVLAVALPLAVFLGLRSVAKAIRRHAKARRAPRPMNAAGETVRVVKQPLFDRGPLPKKPDVGEPEPDEEPTLFQQWIDSGGRMKSVSDQDAVEAAFDLIAGDDSGSEMGEFGNMDGAEKILNEKAGPAWFNTAREKAMKRR